MYEDTLVEMQRQGANHHYSLLFGAASSADHRPAFALFARQTEATTHPRPGSVHAPVHSEAAGADVAAEAERGVVVFVVSGTYDIPSMTPRC